MWFDSTYLVLPRSSPPPVLDEYACIRLGSPALVVIGNERVKTLRDGTQGFETRANAGQVARHKSKDRKSVV